MTITCRTTQDATCPIDAFYPAEVSGSGCDVTVNTSGNEWTLQGTCDVTKVFSSRDRYHCQWYQRFQGSSSAFPITTVKSANTQVPGTSAKPYYSFTCTFSLTLSQLTVGTYDFSVLANPGGTTSTPVTYQIVLPQPRHTCGDEATWRKVGDRLTCTCSADVTGTPAALFRWQNTGNSQLDQVLTSVDDGKQLTCRALWGSDVKASVTYTPKVAYGPNNVTATGPSTPFDTNGQMAMTLNCAPVAFNPSPVNYQWRHLPATNVIGTQSSLPLTPAVSDDGIQVQCTATNTQFASLNASGSYTIVLNYPPSTPPVISGYTNGDVLYADDALTMTCSVSGGKPVSSTTVTFNCDGKSDGTDVISGNDVRSSLTFDRLVAANHNLTCTCSARWKTYDWYKYTAQRTLTVYYPPSNPSITATPFIVGVTSSATVTCRSSTVGFPPVTYNWTQKAGGVQGPGGTLIFATLTPNLHNQSVTCMASNAFTVNKSRPLEDATYRLVVYYRPVISFSAADNSNQCQLTDGRCEVREGNDVTIRCDARSNPDPASISWTRGNSDVSSDAVLTVTSSDHVRDTGVYTCQSVTGALTGISHPAFSSSSNLTVYVLYPPRNVTLTANLSPGNLTVKEGDHVTITCSSRARPTPNLELIGDVQDDVILNATKGGLVTLEDRLTSLDYVISSAACDHTDRYSCSARNDVSGGGGEQDDVDLAVLCRPRLSHPPPTTRPSVNYVDRPVTLTLQLMAFPFPEWSDVTFLGPGENLSEAVPVGLLSTRCWSAGSAFLVNCDITVDKAEKENEGFYHVSFSNQEGDEPVTFQLTFMGDEPPASIKPSEGLSAGAAAGIGVAVTIVVLAAVIVGVWMWRRQSVTLPCLSKDGRHDESHLGAVSVDQHDGHELSDMQEHHNGRDGEHHAAAYQSVPEVSGSSDYAHLNVRDIGQRSEYEQFSPYQNTGRHRGTAQGESSPYEITQRNDSVQTSHYENARNILPTEPVYRNVANSTSS